jgi:excisionase family DNA binding protein
MQARKTIEEPKTQTIAEAAKDLGIGKNQAYAAARRGEIPTIRIGNRILVLREPFKRLLGVVARNE